MGTIKKIALAYSGGLDTSVILKWPIETSDEIRRWIAQKGGIPHGGRGWGEVHHRNHEEAAKHLGTIMESKGQQDLYEPCIILEPWT